MQREDHRLTATVIIEGRYVTATIDTGAFCSFIKQKFAEKLKPNLAYTQERSDVVLANGTRVPISKSTMLNVSLGRNSANCMFLIMPEFNEDVTLGLEFLKDFDADLTVTTNKEQSYGKTM